jgi:hypothetical protein
VFSSYIYQAFFGENHRQALAVHQAAQGPPEVG